jgi:hypothetical protein
MSYCDKSARFTETNSEGFYTFEDINAPKTYTVYYEDYNEFSKPYITVDPSDAITGLI